MWPFLPLVTFLSVGSLCFGFRCHLLSLPPPFPLVSNNPYHPSDFLYPPLTCSLYFLQWCERNELCRRLQLRDLLVAPLQRLTRYPLLLRNMAKRCRMEDETKGLQSVAEQVDTSICTQTTPQPAPNSCEINRNDDTDSLSRCIVAGLISDLVYSVTVKLNSAR